MIFQLDQSILVQYLLVVQDLGKTYNCKVFIFSEIYFEKVISGLIFIFMSLLYQSICIVFIDLCPFKRKEDKHLFLQADSIICENQNINWLLIDLLIQLQIVRNTETYSMQVLSITLPVKQAKLLINAALLNRNPVLT